MSNVPSIFSRPSFRAVSGAVLSNLGTISHPRVSIRGGAFTLIDAGGNHYAAPVVLLNNRPVMLAVVVGANGNKSKMYFREGWDPDNTSPPTCFSDNGLAPSNEAGEPQARTCAECQWNRWGSEISRVTGKGIKACHDKKKIAVTIIGDTSRMIYEFQIPPASLGALNTYGNFLASQKAPDGSRALDIGDVVTAFSFEQQQTGILEFTAFAFLHSVGFDPNGTAQIAYDASGVPGPAPDYGQGIADFIDEIWENNTVAELVGLNDVPYQGPIVLPAQPTPAAIAAQPQRTAQPQPQPQPQNPSPYAPPAGQVPARPVQAFPQAGQGALPQHPTHPQQGQPAQPQGQPATQHGGARPGAGRRPRRQQADPGNVVQHPAAQAQPGFAQPQPQPQPQPSVPSVPAQPGGTEQAIPDFLRRQQNGGAGQQTIIPPQPAAAPQPQPQPANFGMVNAPRPPAQLTDALAHALNVPT